MSIQNSLQTIIDAYELVYTGDGTDTDPATANSFPLGVTSGDMDLLLPRHGGKGTETKANRVALIVLATNAGGADLYVTGAAPGGPEEYICLMECTAGGTVETGTNRWVENITLTNYHLAGCGITVADSGNNHVAKVGFDAIGYRYINFYNTALYTTNEIYVYARHF